VSGGHRVSLPVAATTTDIRLGQGMLDEKGRNSTAELLVQTSLSSSDDLYGAVDHW
jgi:hypothetical protein